MRLRTQLSPSRGLVSYVARAGRERGVFLRGRQGRKPSLAKVPGLQDSHGEGAPPTAGAGGEAAGLCRMSHGLTGRETSRVKGGKGGTRTLRKLQKAKGTWTSGQPRGDPRHLASKEATGPSTPRKPKEATGPSENATGSQGHLNSEGAKGAQGSRRHHDSERAKGGAGPLEG